MTLTEKIEAAIVAYHEKTTEHGEFWRPCEFRHGMEVAEEIAIDIILEHQKGKLELVEITKEEWNNMPPYWCVKMDGPTEPWKKGHPVIYKLNGKFYRLPHAKEEK